MSRHREQQLGPEIPWREITPEATYWRRRDLLRGGAAAALGLSALVRPRAARAGVSPQANFPALPNVRKGTYTTNEVQTPWDAVVSYNNFYEFGTAKSDPGERAYTLKVRPWTVSFE